MCRGEVMTKLLTKAFQKASRLPDDLQDQIAQEFLEEMLWESRWGETLAKSRDKVDRLAEKAAKEYKAGRTREMGFDDL
jgi:hypothetical protein